MTEQETEIYCYQQTILNLEEEIRELKDIIKDEQSVFKDIYDIVRWRV